MKKEELIRKYEQALQDGRAAIFAGAGLSRPSGFVDWKGLLRQLAADIGLDVDKEHDLLALAQFYRNRRGTHAAVSQAIMNAFSKDVKLNDNVKILGRLPISTYWTTNYDNLLEKGIEEANRNPDIKIEQDQLAVIKPNRDAVVYKMHGDFTRPSTTVITKSDYELYENRRPLFRSILKGDLLSKIFLFIGFSFEDPNLDYILGQIHSLLGEEMPEHFCFFKRVQEDEYRDSREYAYHKNRQELQIENLRNYGIQTCLVNSYEEITDILKSIEKVFKMGNVFISGSTEEYTDLWDQERVEELAGKLSGELVRNDFKITSGLGLGIGPAVVNGALEVIYKEKFRHIDRHLCLRPFPQNIKDPEERTKKWREYRESMIEETGISIFLFGNKKHKEDEMISESDGCRMEFEISKEKNNLIIPIGSTGYTANQILEEIKSNLSKYPYLEHYILDLEQETNVDRLVEIVMTIIKKSKMGDDIDV